MYNTSITLLFINSIASIQNIEIQEVQKRLYPQRHLQLIDCTEANQECTEHKIK